MDDVTKNFLRDILQTQGVDAYLMAGKLLQTNMPLQFITVSREMFIDENIRKPLETVEQYIQSVYIRRTNFKGGLGLLIHGREGSGKTALACYVLKQITMMNLSGEFILFDLFLNSFLQHVPLPDSEFLVIDGFGDTPNLVQNKLFELSIGRVEAFLRDRYYKLKPVIITTRLSALEFARIFPKSLCSFLTESTMYVDLSSVSDYRKKLKRK